MICKQTYDYFDIVLYRNAIDIELCDVAINDNPTTIYNQLLAASKEHNIELLDHIFSEYQFLFDYDEYRLLLHISNNPIMFERLINMLTNNKTTTTNTNTNESTNR